MKSAIMTWLQTLRRIVYLKGTRERCGDAETVAIFTRAMKRRRAARHAPIRRLILNCWVRTISNLN